MRMRKKPWAESEVAANPYVITDVFSLRGKWHEEFGNGNAINVEIGTGKGDFIVQSSIANPSQNYIGLERQISVFAVAAKKARERAASGNIRLVSADAASLSEMFSEGEVNEIYVNFCDPWPKSRWEKRRLTHSGFLAKYAKILRSEGRVVFKTDNRDLYDFSIIEFEKNRWQIESATDNLHADLELLPGQQNIMTEYESKFSALGMPIYRIIAKATIFRFAYYQP